MPSEEYRRYAQRTRNRLRERQQLAALGRGAPLRNGGIGAGGIHVDGGTIDIESLGAIEIHGGGGIDVFDGGDVVVHDAGTIDILGGGSLSITGGGGVQVYDGGDIAITGGGDITVTGGGSIEVRDGGNITAVGGMFTGATFRTRSTGYGLRMDTNGLTAVADEGAFAGDQTFLMDEDTGRVDMRDRLVVGGSRYLTGPDSPGVAILPHGVDTGGGSSTSDMIGVFLNYEASTISGSGYSSAGMRVTSPRTSGSRPLDLIGYNGGPVRASGDFEIGGYVTSHLRMGSNDELYLDPGVNVTTSATYVAFVDGTGRLAPSSSAGRFKIVVENVDEAVAPSLLDLHPKTWIDRNAAEAYATYLTRTAVYGPDPNPQDLADIPPLRRIPGLIAEDVEAAGLSQYVNYRTNPATGEEEVWGLAYDRLWTLLIPIIRDLRDRLKALEGNQP